MFAKVHIIVALIDMCVHIYECLKTFLTNLANSHELKRVDLLALIIFYKIVYKVYLR